MRPARSTLTLHANATLVLMRGWQPGTGEAPAAAKIPPLSPAPLNQGEMFPFDITYPSLPQVASMRVLSVCYSF